MRSFVRYETHKSLFIADNTFSGASRQLYLLLFSSLIRYICDLNYSITWIVRFIG